MKKVFFLLMLAVVGIANAKAQKSTISTLFPQKEADLQVKKVMVEKASNDVSTPSKQRLFQNYTPAVQKANKSVSAKKVSGTNQMASDADSKSEKKEVKTEVKAPPMQQESSGKQ